MKKLEIIVRPEKISVLKMIFHDYNVGGVMITKISGYGNQGGKEYTYKGIRYFDNMLNKTKAEVVVTDDVAEQLIERILEDIPTGQQGDGKIFVYDVKSVVRIRTGERDEKAL